MIFSKAAAFDAPIDLSVEVLRGGRTYSTVEVRADQDGQLRSAGLLLLDRGAPSAFEGQVAMPDVAGPEDAPRHDMRVTGRDLRIVDGAYSQDPDLVAPAELYAWIRFRDAPDEQYLHRALLAQPTTHWTIAAAMLPHPGVSEAQAHVTLSTGIMSTSIAFHADVDVSQWLLYANPAIFAGNGHAQGEGHVFTRDGKLVASYTVQAMVRAFTTEPESMGKDYSNAM
jgi:acyl-CoA thioesterase